MNIKYFDNAATTKVAEEVLNEMMPSLYLILFNICTMSK